LSEGLLTAATLTTDALRLMTGDRSGQPAASVDATAPLVEAARGGDRAAFAELYVRYTRMVHGILTACVPRADVDDLVQDVFLQAMRQLGALRDASAFGGWLAAIARNRGRDHLRHTRATEPLEDAAAAGGDATAGFEAQAVLRALRALPEAYRETLALRLIEGMTGPEIAAATGLTPASVRVNLHRGMKQLRERLERGSPRER
jgi:RNA polymerase sigma-70 factor (ECF subfamily)